MGAPTAELRASSTNVTAPAPQQERLAIHADVLAAWLDRAHRFPARWRSPLFARGVDLVRSHLRPLVTRELLAHSYAREHFHVLPAVRPLQPQALLARDSTEVAYALRWLEIGSTERFESWLTLIGEK